MIVQCAFEVLRDALAVLSDEEWLASIPLRE